MCCKMTQLSWDSIIAMIDIADQPSKNVFVFVQQCGVRCFNETKIAWDKVYETRKHKIFVKVKNKGSST